MEILEHLSQQNEKILSEISSLQKITTQIQTNQQWIEKTTTENSNKIAQHHDRIGRVEGHVNSTQWILTKLGALAAFGVGLYSVVFK